MQALDGWIIIFFKPNWLNDLILIRRVSIDHFDVIIPLSAACTHIQFYHNIENFIKMNIFSNKIMI